MAVAAFRRRSAAPSSPINYRPLTIATFLEWAYPRIRATWQYNNILDVLHRDYRSLGRQAHVRGRPIAWVPK